MKVLFILYEQNWKMSEGDGDAVPPRLLKSGGFLPMQHWLRRRCKRDMQTARLLARKPRAFLLPSQTPVNVSLEFH